MLIKIFNYGLASLCIMKINMESTSLWQFVALMQINNGE